MSRDRSSWLLSIPGAGPLASIAARFAESEGNGEPARGARGLAWLAERVDRFAAADRSPQDESAFVEGAGALLALLLLDHLRDGEHLQRGGAHRLRLGSHGFFDPFVAIERALEVEPARAVLIDEVRRAEEETSGAGPIARAARTMETRLRRARTDLAIADRFDNKLWLSDGAEIDLTRLLELDGEPLARAIDKIIGLLPGGHGIDVSPEEARERLMPRVVAGELAALDGLFSRPIAGELRLALVLWYSDRARFVRARELDAWGLSPEEASAHAITRLAATSHRARMARIDTSAGPMVMARSGDGLDSARLVLPGLHDVLAPELGSPFLAAVPHRDALWASRDEPQLRSALEARARDESARAPHRISSAVYRVTGGGIEPA